MKVLSNPFMCFLCVAILMGISNIACTKTSHTTMPADTANTARPAMPDASTISYLALGDSYTIGESVAEGERFPAQAVAALLKMGIHVSTPQYIATTGWTTTDLQNAIATRKPQGPFGIVTLLIGVNDQYRQYPISEYPARFTRLLDTAIALAGNHKERVFVLSIPDYSVTPFGGGSKAIHDDIDDYNAINNKITLANGVAYINITDLSRLAATDPALIAGDGLHPSAKQYALWITRLVPVIENALK